MGVIGGLMLFGSAYYLIISVSTDSIPARWPVPSRSRELYPRSYRAFLLIWAAMGALGAGLVGLSLLR